LTKAWAPFTSNSPIPGVRNARRIAGSGTFAYGTLEEGVENKQAGDSLRVTRGPGQTQSVRPNPARQQRRCSGPEIPAVLHSAAHGREPSSRRSRRFVRATESQVIHGYRAITPGGDRLDEAAVQITPRRVAVHHDDGNAVSGSFIDIMQAPLRRIEPLWRIGPVASKVQSISLRLINQPL
jgi:hypothetical protein